MAIKLAHQQAKAPTDGKDVSTMDYADAAGGPADDLSTTGADVNVSGAAPPSAGQTLTADDATNASWQTPAPSSDTKTEVTGADTTPGNLAAKVAAGANVSLAVLNPGANEQLEITSSLVGASTEKFINTIRAGDVGSHDSATPKVVSQFEFDPTVYALNSATRSLIFKAVASNGGGVASTTVVLFNLTDAEIVATLSFTSATPTKKEATLTEGGGAGQIDLSAKIYEVRIWVVAPDLIDDTIELGSAEIQVINTID